MINTFTRMGVPIGICSAHRERTCVTWALGISRTERAANGGAGSCVNLECKKRISKLTTMAGVFNHSVCNNDELKEIQLEVLELDQALDLVRRNDMRYEGHYCLAHKGRCCWWMCHFVAAGMGPAAWGLGCNLRYHFDAHTSDHYIKTSVLVFGELLLETQFAPWAPSIVHTSTVAEKSWAK